MTASTILLVALILSVPVCADIVVDTLDIKTAFDKSDLICNCSVGPIVVVEERLIPSPPGPPLKRRLMRASVEVEDAYKVSGPAEQSVVIEYYQDLPSTSASQPGLFQGETALLFLRATSSAHYAFSDPFFGATAFNTLPKETGEPGLSKLESALAAATTQPNRSDRISALRILQGFVNLRQDTISTMRCLLASDDSEIAIMALAVFLKTKTPESVEELKTYLDLNKEKPEPVGLGTLATELGQIRDERAIGTIEALSSSQYVSIRYGALQALRGTKDPRSIPTLVKRLDDPDSTNQYLAVIALAEILGNYGGDLAPSMYLFDKKPQYYIGLWKRWWDEEGKARYESTPDH